MVIDIPESWHRLTSLRRAALRAVSLLLAVLLAACGRGSVTTVAPVVTPQAGATTEPAGASPGVSVVAPIGVATPPRANSVASDTRPVTVPDFPVVAYQGADLLGGNESRFAHVFAQGQPIVLNFWAGLCPPCRAEMPTFQKVADEYSGKVIFVGVDVGPFVGLGSHDDARALLSHLGIRYPVAYAMDASPLRLYQVQGMPTTYFLSAEGKVVHKQTGALPEERLRTLVEALATSP